MVEGYGSTEVGTITGNQVTLADLAFEILPVEGCPSTDEHERGELPVARRTAGASRTVRSPRAANSHGVGSMARFRDALTAIGGRCSSRSGSRSPPIDRAFLGRTLAALGILPARGAQRECV